MACFEHHWIPASAGMTFVLFARRLIRAHKKRMSFGRQELAGNSYLNLSCTMPALRLRLIRYYKYSKIAILLCKIGTNTRSYLFFNLQANTFTFGLLLS